VKHSAISTVLRSIALRRRQFTILVLFTILPFAAAFGGVKPAAEPAHAKSAECALVSDTLLIEPTTACAGDDSRGPMYATSHSGGSRGYPKYCCTSVGRLGPYDNDSVPEGGACYGTKDDRRYEGTACYGDDDKANKQKKHKKKHDDDDFPQYCCTNVGRLGPYKNDSVQEGGRCYGTKNGRRYEGTACYDDDDDDDDDGGNT
jgi:hypothetical protein